MDSLYLIVLQTTLTLMVELHVQNIGGLLFALILEFGGSVWDASMGDTSGNGAMYWMAFAITFFPSIAVGARRLHDVGKSGWWQLIAFTIVGLIPLIIWLATEGTKKSNSHGKSIKLKK